MTPEYFAKSIERRAQRGFIHESGGGKSWYSQVCGADQAQSRHPEARVPRNADPGLNPHVPAGGVKRRSPFRGRRPWQHGFCLYARTDPPVHLSAVSGRPCHSPSAFGTKGSTSSCPPAEGVQNGLRRTDKRALERSPLADPFGAAPREIAPSSAFWDLGLARRCIPAPRFVECG